MDRTPAPGPTPSQTIGPFFAIGLPSDDGPYAVPDGTPGAIWIRGRVLDGEGESVPDSMVETWQAGPDGGFGHAAGGHGSAVPGFRGFGRSPTDADGRFAILTLKPGRVDTGARDPQAPHIDVSVFARGLLKRVVTRIYFPDEPDANASDPVLSSIADPAARATLVAEPADDGYGFDVRLQGDRQTVFFAL
jgi:protocatechuate 3,4-dioxygenase, alpha subunit